MNPISYLTFFSVDRLLYTYSWESCGPSGKVWIRSWAVVATVMRFQLLIQQMKFHHRGSDFVAADFAELLQQFTSTVKTKQKSFKDLKKETCGAKDSMRSAL